MGNIASSIVPGLVGLTLCFSAVWLVYARRQVQRVVVSRDQRGLNQVLREMEGKYLTNDLVEQHEDESSTPQEELRHRQKEALRHVILQVFAYVPIKARILKYPTETVKGIREPYYE